MPGSNCRLGRASAKTQHRQDRQGVRSSRRLTWKRVGSSASPRPNLPNVVSPAVELIAAERAALEEVADRIGRQPGLRGQGCVAVVLGAPGWTIAVGVGPGIVPPSPLVVRGPVE